MKKIILSIAVILVAGTTAFAQKIAESAVPKAVLTSYNKMFTGAAGSVWEKASTGDYSVDFTQNSMVSSAKFNTAGKILRSEQQVYITSLSTVIIDYVYNNFKTRDYVSAAKITDAGKVSYNTKFMIGTDLVSLMFDDKGNFVSKEVAKAQ